MLTHGGTGTETAQELVMAVAATAAPPQALAPDLPPNEAWQASSERPSPALAAETPAFEPPEPLLLAKLSAAKRETLFG